MKMMAPIKVSDEEYWALKKKMVELNCMTWREFLLKLLDLTKEEPRGVFDSVKEGPSVAPALHVEKGEAEKPKAPLVKGIRIMRGKTLKIREGKKVVITK